MLLSVVIPCLNESDTIATCVEKARSTAAEIDSETEVIVADNGSVDGSQALALAAGARVVSVPEKGYGNALMGGIDAAKGHYVILVDADDSYDFRQIPLFLEKLRAGNELVLGCRLPSGGGRISPGAMPWLHRWLGNPIFSFLARSWFHAPIHDVNCGMRGLTKDLYRRLEQRCTGMAFATEMVIKASLLGAKIAELPVTLKRDGRKNHPPHLCTFHDGWDTLRVFLLFNPRARFLSKVPGLRCNGHPSRGDEN
jgi:glycosyltransferase involved in cell wall biosynthesis